ncbi:serine protease SP24D-like [Brevipalpus obovatus]|uniref:serine protease SP24D-like n=1 Tax=Brevipalpus obovatus TaxID=246614 RepID=UPI003D9EF820
MLFDPRFILCTIFISIEITVKCEEPPEPSKITNGFPAAPSSYPYIVAIMQPPEEVGGNANMYGGGAILSEWWILTARSVISNSKNLLEGPRKVYIYPKYDNNLRKIIRNGAKFFKPAKIFCPPHEVTDVLDQQTDLALIKLSEPLPLGLPPHNFRPVRIAKSTERGQSARIAGWGRAVRNEPASKMNDLMEAEISLPSFTICLPKCKIFTRIKSPIGGYPNPCHGDEGGPAVIRNPHTFEDEVVGVIVYQDSYCLMKSIFVNTSTYLPWINRVMETETAKFEC